MKVCCHPHFNARDTRDGQAGRVLDRSAEMSVVAEAKIPHAQSKQDLADAAHAEEERAKVAAMNSSRSPSSTPAVSEVCTPVRRSFTI